jgi:hypothetical protein
MEEFHTPPRSPADLQRMGSPDSRGREVASGIEKEAGPSLEEGPAREA